MAKVHHNQTSKQTKRLHSQMREAKARYTWGFRWGAALSIAFFVILGGETLLARLGIFGYPHTAADMIAAIVAFVVAAVSFYFWNAYSKAKQIYRMAERELQQGPSK